MAALLLHNPDVLRLASDVNNARSDGFAPSGGLSYYKGQFYQLMLTGESTVTYHIIMTSSDGDFTDKANIAAGLGANALGPVFTMQGNYIQAFGDSLGGGGGSGLPPGDTVDQMLQWDGSTWQPGDLPFTLPPGDTVDQMLQWDGTAWVPGDLPFTLPDGSTVDQMLQWDGTAWVPGDQPFTLPDGSTVDQMLQWDGSTWQPGSVPSAGLTPGTTVDQMLQWDGTAWVPGDQPFTVDDGTTSGQVIGWDGTAWVPTTSSGGGITPGTVVGQTTQWSGSAWSPGITPANAQYYTESGGLPVITYPSGIVGLSFQGPDATSSAMQMTGNTGTVLAKMTATTTAVGMYQGTGTGGRVELTSTSIAIRVSAATRMTISNTATIVTECFNASATSLRPLTDNAMPLGNTSFRWSEVWSANGSIQTSDAAHKTAPQSISDTILDAVGDIDFVSFKMLDAVAVKGDEARTHFGVIAQQVYDAFTAHGLDPFAYGVLCYDEWGDIPEIKDDTNTVLQPYRAAGSIMSVRYTELQCLNAAYMRRELARLSSK